MADASKDKMGDSSIEKLCESMQKVFAQFMEQAQLRSNTTSEGSKIISSSFF